MSLAFGGLLRHAAVVDRLTILCMPYAWEFSRTDLQPLHYYPLLRF